MEQEKKNSLEELMKTTMEHVKVMADANTIIGTPIHAEGVTLIPVSRMSFGVGGGRHRIFGQSRSSERGVWRRQRSQRQAGAGGFSDCSGGRQCEAAPCGPASRNHRRPSH